MDSLNNININPTAYTNRQTPSLNNSNEQYNEQISNNQKQEAKDKEQCVKRADNHCRQGNTSIPGHNNTILQDSEIIKTRSDELLKNQKDWHISINNHKPL